MILRSISICLFIDYCSRLSPLCKNKHSGGATNGCSVDDDSAYGIRCSTKHTAGTVRHVQQLRTSYCVSLLLYLLVDWHKQSAGCLAFAAGDCSISFNPQGSAVLLFPPVSPDDAHDPAAWLLCA